MQIQYSIIISAYNVEKYITSALNSALSQTTPSPFEVIVVDDCSTDDTSSILNHTTKNANLRIIRLDKNRGLSYTRNKGIIEARGKWILFLDGDDVMHPDLLRELDNVMGNPYLQLIVFGFDKMSDNLSKKIYTFQPQNNLNDIYTGAWNKAYRSDLIANLRFPVGKYYEDMAFTAIAFLTAQNVAIIDRPLINYRLRDSGITQSTSISKHFDIFDVLQQLVDFRDSADLSSTIKKRINLLINKQLFVHSYEARKNRGHSLVFKKYFNLVLLKQKEWKTGIYYDTNTLKQVKDMFLMFWFTRLSN